MTETAQQKLERAVALFERVGGKMFDDGIWTCNSGAAAFSYICHRFGIEHELCVGLYYWPDEMLEEKWGLLEGGTPDENDLDGYWRDEHHHWVRVPALGCIVDPNGEIRGVDRLVFEADAPDVYERYCRSDLKSDFLVYDPSEPIESIASWDKEVAQAVALIDQGLGPKLAPVDGSVAALKPGASTVIPGFEIE